MKQYMLILLSLLISISFGIQAQDKPTQWTLKGCLDYALEHNIQVKKNKIALEESKVDTKTAKAQLFPSLTASVTQGLVNYPSNEVATHTSYSGNYTLNANLKLFDGGKRTTAIKQQQLQTQMQELGIEQSEDDIEIAITQTYLQVLYAYEAVRINENTVEVSAAQRDRSAELLKAGSISRTDMAQMESQLSTDKYQLVVAQTKLENYKLQLKQLLELNINEQIFLQIPKLSSVDVLSPLPDKQTVYQTSLSVMPQIKSSHMSISIAELEKKKAKAGYLPSLSLNAGLGTGHLSGTDYSFGSQMWNKFNQSIGLTLSIPIFSNRENKSAVEKAQLAYESSQLDFLNAEKELLKTVEGVYLDAISSQNQYTSAIERLKSVEESYKLTEEQFYLGMKNTLELLTEKTNLLTAQQEVLQSKYMSILGIQLLNFYQKKPIDINY